MSGTRDASVERMATADPGIARARALARILDDYFVDPLIGLVLPGVGDVIASVLGLYIVAIALRRRVSPVVIARMLLRAWGSPAGSRWWRRIGRGGPAHLAKGIHPSAEYDRVTDGLDQPDRNLDLAAVEHAPAGPDAICHVLAKLDADRLDAPLGRVEEHRLYRSDDLPVGADHRSSSKILI